MILAGRWDFFDGSDMCPIPVDSDNITEAEKQDGKRWDREDVIAQCLLGERLPIETAMDMDAFPTAKAQWNAVNAPFTTKSVYMKADLHQAFLDMRCLKGGDVQEYLTSLKMKCCYGLFRSIVLSLLIQTYPQRVSNYSRIICTTGPFIPLVYLHARMCRLIRYLDIQLLYYLTHIQESQPPTFLFRMDIPTHIAPSWSTHSESYPPLYP